VSPLGATTKNAGTSQAYTIVASSGYHIVDVKVDGISQGQVAAYTFTNIQANHTLAATFAVTPPITYTITSSVSGGNGSISPLGATSVTSGGSQAYSATPDSGYVNFSLVVDGVSMGPLDTYTFSNVTHDHSITVAFYPNVPQPPFTPTTPSPPVAGIMDSWESFGAGNILVDIFDGAKHNTTAISGTGPTSKNPVITITLPYPPLVSVRLGKNNMLVVTVEVG
jgi:hypothetical protein